MSSRSCKKIYYIYNPMWRTDKRVKIFIVVSNIKVFILFSTLFVLTLFWVGVIVFSPFPSLPPPHSLYSI